DAHYKYLTQPITINVSEYNEHEKAMITEHLSTSIGRDMFCFNCSALHLAMGFARLVVAFRGINAWITQPCVHPDEALAKEMGVRQYYGVGICHAANIMVAATGAALPFPQIGVTANNIITPPTE